MTNQQQSRQTIERLTQRYNQLNTKKIEAETNLKSARKQLEELQKEARETYGTDDLEALQQKLAEMEAENEKKRADYQATLDRIETDLDAVEEKYRHSGADSGK